MRSRIVSVFMALALVVFARGAQACPSCFGPAKGPMADGLNDAVLTMLGITGVVLAGVATFFFVWLRRRQRLFPMIPARITEPSSLQWNTF